MKQTLLKSQNNLKNKQSNIRKNNIKDRRIRQKILNLGRNIP